MARIDKIIANINKKKFEELKITQEKFIENYNLSSKNQLEISKFRKLLNGHVDNFTLKTLEEMGNIFKVPYEEYFGFKGYSYQRKNLIKTLKNNLKFYRNLKKMNQKEFAKELGISYCSYKRYEGNYGNPRKDILIQIANKLNIAIINLIK